MQIELDDEETTELSDCLTSALDMAWESLEDDHGDDVEAAMRDFASWPLLAILRKVNPEMAEATEESIRGILTERS